MGIGSQQARQFVAPLAVHMIAHVISIGVVKHGGWTRSAFRIGIDDSHVTFDVAIGIRLLVGFDGDGDCGVRSMLDISFGIVYIGYGEFKWMIAFFCGFCPLVNRRIDGIIYDLDGVGFNVGNYLFVDRFGFRCLW